MEGQAGRRRVERIAAQLRGGVQACECAGAQAGRSARELFEAEGVAVVGPAGPLGNAGTERTLLKWHEAVATGMAGRDEEMMAIMDDILAEDIVFLAPTYHKERRDKTFVKFALVGVTKAFKNFRYTRAFLGDEGFALEFSCNLGTEDGPFMRGIDLVSVNAAGKIEKFEVMARPPKAVLKLLDLQTDFMRKAGLLPPPRAKK